MLHMVGVFDYSFLFCFVSRQPDGNSSALGQLVQLRFVVVVFVVCVVCVKMIYKLLEGRVLHKEARVTKPSLVSRTIKRSNFQHEITRPWQIRG